MIRQLHESRLRQGRAAGRRRGARAGAQGDRRRARAHALGREVFTFRLLPRGRFAPVVASIGERPSGFAQFEVGQDGKLGALRLTADDGQAWEFRRE